MLIELVAFSGEVRCVRSLVAAFRSLTAKPVNARTRDLVARGSGLTGDPCSSSCNEPPMSDHRIFLQRASDANYMAVLPSNSSSISSPLDAKHSPPRDCELPDLGCAIHICCARGHVNLLEYLLVQLGDSRSVHLTAPCQLRLTSLHPALQLARPCSQPLDYAILYDRSTVISHVLAHVPMLKEADLVGKLSSLPKTNPSSASYTLSIPIFRLYNLLERSVIFGSQECVRILNEFWSKDTGMLKHLSSNCYQLYYFLAAYWGPDMIALFDHVPISVDIQFDLIILQRDPFEAMPHKRESLCANFEYLKQQILPWRPPSSQLLAEQGSPISDSQIAPQNIVDVQSVNVWCDWTRRLMKTICILSAWMHIYYHYCVKPELPDLIKTANTDLANSNCTCSGSLQSKCAHETLNSAEDNMCPIFWRENLLRMLTDLLAFVRKEDTFNVRFQLPDLPIRWNCPILDLMLIFCFKAMQRISPSSVLMQLPAKNSSQALVCFMELILRHVITQYIPGRCNIYQLLYESFRACVLDGAHPYIAITDVHGFRYWADRTTCGVTRDRPLKEWDEPWNMKAYGQLCVLVLMRAVEKFGSGSTFKEPNAGFQTYSGLAEALFPVANEVAIIYAKAWRSTEGQSILEALLKGPLPITSVLVAIHIRDDDCIQYVNRYSARRQDAAMFGFQMFRPFLLAANPLAARKFMQHFIDAFPNFFQANCRPSHRSHSPSNPKIAPILAVLCWEQITEKLSGIRKTHPVAQSLELITCNAIWVAMLSDAPKEEKGTQSGKEMKSINYHIDHLRAPPFLKKCSGLKC